MLEPLRIIEGLRKNYPSPVISIDSHTAGEPTRLIVDGMGSIPGASMREKGEYFQDHCDHIRLLLTREPRGHRGIMAACLTEPVSEGAAFGLIFMDARRYPFLCGHATIGAVTTLIEAGILKGGEPETSVVVDTPSGPMRARARLRGRQVESVAIQMVPSFVYSTDQILEMPSLGAIAVDTVCVGGFFVMVSAEQIGLEQTAENSAEWRKLGMAFIEAANRQITVRHPLRPEVRTVDVVSFYDPRGHERLKGSNIVIYGESNMDRSPCGTGTAAKLTLLHHRGQLGLNQVFDNSGPLQAVFEGRIVETTRVGELDAVITEIRGSAHMTGVHQFVIDAADPFPEGFILS